jgi:hypothetical protein
MRYRVCLLAVLAVVVTACVGLFAASAFAFPTDTTPCDDCHSGSGATANAVLGSNNGVTATYTVTVTGSGPLGWGVFLGPTRVAGGAGSGGTFAVPAGSTYAVFGVNGPTTTDGLAFQSITPTAASNPTDTTPPTTFSDAINMYLGAAHIYLTAQDNPGGSGVAATFYIIDNGPVQTGPYVVVTGTGDHFVRYWSIDNAGNTEAIKTSDIYIVSSQVLPEVHIRTSTSSMRLGGTFTVSGRMFPSDPSDQVHVLVMKPGSTKWSESSIRPIYDEFPGEVGLWKYYYTPVVRGTYRFRAGFYGDIARKANLSIIVKVAVR